MGKAVKVDETTMLAMSGKFAQVSVEIVLAIIGHIQPVEHEGHHQICFRCDQYGHKDELCLKLDGGNDRTKEDVQLMVSPTGYAEERPNLACEYC